MESKHVRNQSLQTDPQLKELSESALPASDEREAYREAYEILKAFLATAKPYGAPNTGERPEPKTKLQKFLATVKPYGS